MEQTDFGIRIRQLREQKGLLLRQIAAVLEVDTALVSKIERGERKASKDQVVKFAELLEVNTNELLVIWLSDKIVDMLAEEPLAHEALKNSEKRLKNK
jgi:transcriptional regulator with XRE-family HTH domain